MEVFPIVGPQDPDGRYPYLQVLDKPDQLTCRPADVGRQEGFYQYQKLPPHKKGLFMPEPEWAPFLNMLYHHINLAEITGGHTFGPDGSGKKAKAQRDAANAKSLLENGRWYNSTHPVSPHDMEWARNFSPLPRTEQPARPDLR